eukprot:s344_g18.t1
MPETPPPGTQCDRSGSECSPKEGRLFLLLSVAAKLGVNDSACQLHVAYCCRCCRQSHIHPTILAVGSGVSLLSLLLLLLFVISMTIRIFLSSSLIVIIVAVALLPRFLMLLQLLLLLLVWRLSWWVVAGELLLLLLLWLVVPVAVEVVVVLELAMDLEAGEECKVAVQTWSLKLEGIFPLEEAKCHEPFTVSQQVLAPSPFPRSTYLPMAMTLRSVVALALVAFAVTEDMPQDAAPALEALPQRFWDNFVYCKCGLSCAEKDGSIGKACGCLVCPESNGTSLRGSQPPHADEKAAASAKTAQAPERQGTPVALEKSLASGWDLPSAPERQGTPVALEKSLASGWDLPSVSPVPGVGGHFNPADVDAAVGTLAKSFLQKQAPPPAPRAPAEGVFSQLADLSRLARNLPVYRKLQCIGRGSFGKAYLVEVVRSGKKKADTASYRVLKKLPLLEVSEAQREGAFREAQLMRKISRNCPFITQFHEVLLCRGGTVLCLIMEYCSGGDLRGEICRQRDEAEGQKFAEDRLLRWASQIALALRHCHSRGILHRDVKPENCFFRCPGGALLLGDFGISCDLDEHHLAKTCCGSPLYLSPEIVNQEPYDYASDAWSFGVTLYEIAMLAPPFKGLNICQAAKAEG